MAIYKHLVNLSEEDDAEIEKDIISMLERKEDEKYITLIHLSLIHI